MDCIVHGVTKSQTRLSDFHFQASYSTIAIGAHLQKDVPCKEKKKIFHRVNQKKFLDKRLESLDYLIVMHLRYLIENPRLEIRRLFRPSLSIVKIEKKVKEITQVIRMIRFSISSYTFDM